jgi:hypothetical protein
VKELLIKKEKHDLIKLELEECQGKIKEIVGGLGDMEWEYEVKLQQFQYLEREKKDLFDEFHRLVYELHQKTGLRNLILEKKLETINESLETKDA